MIHFTHDMAKYLQQREIFNNTIIFSNKIDRYPQEFIHSDHKRIFVNEVAREWLMKEVRFELGLEA